MEGDIVEDMVRDALGKRCCIPEKVPLGGLQLWVPRTGVWTPLRICGHETHIGGQGHP